MTFGDAWRLSSLLYTLLAILLYRGDDVKSVVSRWGCFICSALCVIAANAHEARVAVQEIALHTAADGRTCDGDTKEAYVNLERVPEW